MRGLVFSLAAVGIATGAVAFVAGMEVGGVSVHTLTSLFLDGAEDAAATRGAGGVPGLDSN